MDYPGPGMNMTQCNPSHNCANCPSRQTTEWRDLTGAELALVDQAKQTRMFDPGTTLYDQGDEGGGIHCIQSGLIGLRRLDEDGNSALLRLCSGGTTIGYRAYLTKEAHLNWAEVMTPSIVCFIERSYVTRLLAANLQLGERFLQHAIEDLSEVESDYARSMTRSMKSRFLHVLMVFYEQLGYRDDTGSPTVELPIKRGELAEMIGAQPESISRLIRQVQMEGLLQIDDRRVQIHDMEAVLRKAGVTF